MADLDRRPLLIVDGDNLTHRAYHSSPKSIRGKDGEPFNAITGFFGMLIRVWTAEQPRGVFVAWDTLGVATYRSALWPDYQGGRQFDAEVVVQLNRLPDLCAACGFGVAKVPGYEADDLIASAVIAETNQGGSCLIYTTDKDSYQLVNESVTVLSPKRGSRELERVGPEQVVEKLGVLPEQVPDFKALAGDSSDKIPGARGIGPKGAAQLLLKHGTLDEVLRNWEGSQDLELIRNFRKMVAMQTDAPVTLPSSPDWRSGAAKINDVGGGGIAQRLLELA